MHPDEKAQLLEFIQSFEENLRSKGDIEYSPETIHECLVNARGLGCLVTACKPEYLVTDRGYTSPPSLLLDPEFCNPLVETLRKWGYRDPLYHIHLPDQVVVTQLQHMGTKILRSPNLLLERALYVDPADEEFLTQYWKRLHQGIQEAPGSWCNSKFIHNLDPGNHPHCFQHAKETLIRSISEHPKLSEQVLRCMDTHGPRGIQHPLRKQRCGRVRTIYNNMLERCFPLTQVRKKHPPLSKKTLPKQLAKVFDSLDRTKPEAVRTFLERLDGAIMDYTSVSKAVEQTSRLATQKTTRDTYILDDSQNSRTSETCWEKPLLHKHDLQDFNSEVDSISVSAWKSACSEADITDLSNWKNARSEENVTGLSDWESACSDLEPSDAEPEFSKNPNAFFSRSSICEHATQRLHCDATSQKGQFSYER